MPIPVTERVPILQYYCYRQVFELYIKKNVYFKTLSFPQVLVPVVHRSDVKRSIEGGSVAINLNKEICTSNN